MTPEGFVSIVCLLITGWISAAGVFSKHFDDSLAQCAGLGALATACFLGVVAEIRQPHTSFTLTLLAEIGLATYASGTAYKFWPRRHHGIERRAGRRYIGTR
jgi:hypothetical protein